MAVGGPIATSSDDSGDDDGSLPDSITASVQELREIPMPEISEAAGYLVALLHSAGIATSTGMGLVGLSWQEIESWARCNDFVALESKPEVTKKRYMRSLRKKTVTRANVVGPKELKAIWGLSRAYAGESAVASKKGAKAPYTPPVIETKDEVVREMIETKVEDVFASMMSAQTRD